MQANRPTAGRRLPAVAAVLPLCVLGVAVGMAIAVLTRPPRASMLLGRQFKVVSTTKSSPARFQSTRFRVASRAPASQLHVPKSDLTWPSRGTRHYWSFSAWG
jgi:hypothetical protein